MTKWRKIIPGKEIAVNMKKKTHSSKPRKVKQEEVETQETVQHAQDDVQQEKSTELAELEEKYAALQRDYDEVKEKFLRLLADFDNQKKRAIKEKAELLRTASQDTLSALLPVLDDFDRAKQLADQEGSTETMSEGVLLVYHKFSNTLRGLGLEAMHTNGEPFDPELHEAVTEIPAFSDDMRGKVVDTIEKGYKLGDKIIRYAKVVVGK